MPSIIKIWKVLFLKKKKSCRLSKPLVPCTSENTIFKNPIYGRLKKTGRASRKFVELFTT